MVNFWLLRTSLCGDTASDVGRSSRLAFWIMNGGMFKLTGGEGLKGDSTQIEISSLLRREMKERRKRSLRVEIEFSELT